MVVIILLRTASRSDLPRRKEVLEAIECEIDSELNEIESDIVRKSLFRTVFKNYMTD